MRAPSAPSVTIVVVAYNSAHVIPGLLDSIPRALGGLSAEIIVVDNSSSDDTVTVVRRRGECRVLVEPNLGYAAGINRGVAAACSDGPILVLNPDVRLRPNAVRLLVEALDSPGVGIVVPRVLEPDGRVSLSMRREPSLGRTVGLGSTGRPRFSEYVTDLPAYDRRQTCDWALGAVMLVDRSCHEALGGWDESYFLYSEETDFCLRARDSGWSTVFVPEAEAVHIGGQSGQSGLTHAMQVINRVRLYHRRNGRLRGWAYFGLTVATELSWLARGNRRSGSALVSLLLPSRRPPQLGLARSYLPT